VTIRRDDIFGVGQDAFNMDAVLHATCGLCGIRVTSSDQAKEILLDMDADGKTCPHCFRTFGAARREEGIHPPLSAGEKPWRFL
jgi:hypothetical protein